MSFFEKLVEEFVKPSFAGTVQRSGEMITLTFQYAGVGTSVKVSRSDLANQNIRISEKMRKLLLDIQDETTADFDVASLVGTRLPSDKAEKMFTILEHLREMVKDLRSNSS